MDRRSSGRPALLLASLVVLVAATACSDSSGGPAGVTGDLTVGSGGSYPTIQAAVAAAAPGARIVLAPGTYDERVLVSKNLDFTGAGAATVLRSSQPSGAPSDDSAVLILRGVTGVTMENLTFSGGIDNGILIRDSRDIQLVNVAATGNLDHGLVIRNSDDVDVTGGDFSGNEENGIRIRDQSSGVTVTDVTAEGNGENGVLVRDSQSVAVTDSRIADNGESGIRVRDSAAGNVTNNEITGNGEWGIRLESSGLTNEATVLADNSVSGNTLGNLRVE